MKYWIIRRIEPPFSYAIAPNFISDSLVTSTFNFKHIEIKHKIYYIQKKVV